MEDALVTITELYEPDEAIRTSVARRFRVHVAHRRLLHVLDLRRLPSLDTATLGALVLANRLAREAGGAVALVADDARMRQTLSVTAFDRIFPIHASVEAAVAALQPSGRLSA